VDSLTHPLDVVLHTCPSCWRKDVLFWRQLSWQPLALLYSQPKQIWQSVP